MKPEQLKALPPDLFPGVLYLYDLTGQEGVYMSVRHEELLGFSSEDIQQFGQNGIAQLIHPEDKDEADRMIQRLTQEPPGQVVQTEYRLQDKEGNWRWFLDSACVSRTDEQGQQQQIAGVALDISESRETKTAFNTLQRLFEMLLEMAPLAIYWKDAQGRYMGYNRYYLKSIGLNEDEDIRGKSDSELSLSSQEKEQIADGEERALQSEHGAIEEIETFNDEQGNTLHIRARRAPIKENDQNLGIFTLYEDVTPQMRLPKQLEEWQQRYHFALNTGPSILFVVDNTSLEILETNQPAQNQFELTQENQKALSFEQLIVPSEKEAFFQWLRKEPASAHSPQERESFSMITKEGVEQPFHVYARSLIVSDRSVVRLDMFPVEDEASKESEEQKNQQIASLESSYQAAMEDASKLRQELESQQLEKEEQKNWLEQVRNEQDEKVLEESRKREETESELQKTREENQALREQITMLQSEAAERKDALLEENKQLCEELEQLRKEAHEETEDEMPTMPLSHNMQDLEAHLPLARIGIDQEYQVTDWNEAARQLFGHRRRAALGQPFLRLLFPRRLRPSCKGIFQAVLNQQEPKIGVFECLTSEGQTRECRWFFACAPKEENTQTTLYAYAIDITREEPQTNGNEASFLGQIIEQETSPILVVAVEDHRILYANASAARYFGRSARRLQKTGLDSFVKQDTQPLAMVLEQANRQMQVAEINYNSSSGQMVPAKTRVYPIWKDTSLHAYCLKIENTQTETNNSAGPTSTQLLQLCDTLLPLASTVSGYCECLNRALKNDQADLQSHFVSPIQRATFRIQKTLQNIDDWQRLQTKQYLPAYTWCDPRQLFDEDCAEWESIARERDIIFHVDRKEPLPESIQIPYALLRSIVLELLDNALRFTTQGSLYFLIQIEKVANEQSQLVLKIKDTGPGAANATHEQWLQPFFRAYANAYPWEKGMGLGLPLCQEWIKMIGGTLNIESELPRGTLVTGILPVEQSERPGYITARGGQNPLRKRKAIEPDSQNVLLLSRDWHLSRMLKTMLVQIGCRVESVHEADGLKARTAQQKVDLLLANIEAHDDDLLGELAKLRGHAEFQTLKIIGLTTTSSEAMRKACLDAGLHDCWKLPLSLKQLEAVCN